MSPRTPPQWLLLPLVTALIASLATGCVTYRNFPREYVNAPPPHFGGKATYKVVGSSIAGGVRELGQVLESRSFANMERVEERPSQGYYVEVHVKGQAPAIPAMVFGYISFSLLTLTPFWSTQDGSDLYFEVYRDNQRLQTLHYEVRRMGFVWLPMLPIAWVNFFTYSEEDAFRAIANKFFEDARPLFEG